MSRAIIPKLKMLYREAMQERDARAVAVRDGDKAFSEVDPWFYQGRMYAYREIWACLTGADDLHERTTDEGVKEITKQARG